MTVRMMIKQLLNYPMDSQVVDSDGSPIMYMCFHSRENDELPSLIASEMVSTIPKRYSKARSLCHYSVG